MNPTSSISHLYLLHSQSHSLLVAIANLKGFVSLMMMGVVVLSPQA